MNKINFDELMDLRIDFAFKLLFTKSDPRLLVSLLNAIFANKKIPRIIENLTILNPYLDKEYDNDKLSILDIKAKLDDNTDILIEMHMYGLGELKAKTIRSWAKVFATGLKAGEDYSAQPPAISIAFSNGKIDNTTEDDKIHKLCMIMDVENHTIFTNSMELHYINMQSFIHDVNKTGKLNINEALTKWLLIITQKEINDKSLIEEACKYEEEIQVAVSELAKQWQDEVARIEYFQRQDEIYFANKREERYKKIKENYRQAQEALEEYKQAQEEYKRVQEEYKRVQEEKETALRLAEEERLKANAEIEKLRKELERYKAVSVKKS